MKAFLFVKSQNFLSNWGDSEPQKVCFEKALITRLLPGTSIMITASQIQQQRAPNNLRGRKKEVTINITLQNYKITLYNYKITL